jgi:hypothetical protein
VCALFDTTMLLVSSLWKTSLDFANNSIGARPFEGCVSVQWGVQDECDCHEDRKVVPGLGISEKSWAFLWDFIHLRVVWEM